MDIGTIRERVRAGNYFVKSHAVQHAIKEGFDRAHMVEAILTGMIIEEYPDNDRALICGRISLVESQAAYLHVVCEYIDPEYVDFVTAYLPDETWEIPPFRRRRARRN